MGIKKELTESQFIDQFREFNRLDEDGKTGNFTREGLRHLYEYLNNLSDDIGQDIEMDVIAICCDYTEYKDLDDYLNDRYTTDEIDKKFKEITGKEPNEYGTDDEITFKEAVEQEIIEKTTLIKFSDDLDDGFIIQNY